MNCMYHDLVEAGKQGNREALEELIVHLHPLIYAAIRRYGYGQEPEELYQQACLSILEAVKEYEPERGVPFLALVKSRVYFGLFNRIKKEKTLISLDQPLEGEGGGCLLDMLQETGPQTEERVIWMEKKEQLKKAVDKLSPKQREVICLYYLEGISLKAIARQRGCHYKAVLRLKDRALRKLRNILSE